MKTEIDNHNFEDCKDCKKYVAEQQLLAQEDASYAKNMASLWDVVTNHCGNAAYSLTLFIKNIPAIPLNLLNGIPWLNMIFMIVGGMFRIVNAALAKDTTKTTTRKKRYLYLIPSIILGLATMTFGIAGLVVFSIHLSLILMAVSAAIDLATSLVDITKTTHDYFSKTHIEQLQHGVKIALRIPTVVISIAALIGCALLITIPPVGGAILIATAAASIIYVALDVTNKNPIKALYFKLRGVEEIIEPALKSTTKQCKIALKIKAPTIGIIEPTMVKLNNHQTKRAVIDRWTNKPTFIDLVKLFFNPKTPQLSREFSTKSTSFKRTSLRP